MSRPIRAAAFSTKSRFSESETASGAGNAGKVELAAQSLGAALEGTLHLGEHRVDHRRVAGAHVAFEAHVVGHAVDRIAALGDDEVDAHMVGVAERLAQRVNGVDAGDRGVKRVDPLIGRGGGVSLLALVAHHEHAEAVAVVGDGKRRPRGELARVDHHRHIDVVELAQTDELRLAAQIGDRALVAHLLAAVDLDELFRGNGHQRHGTVELLHDAASDQRRRRGQHDRRLKIVPAAVRSAVERIGLRVVAANDAVEFADQRHFWPLVFADVGAKPGQRDALLQFQSQRFEIPGQFGAGARFEKSQLGVGRDVFRIGADHRLRRVDRGKNSFLQRLSVNQPERLPQNIERQSTQKTKDRDFLQRPPSHRGTQHNFNCDAFLQR